jgi:hypothetical protein
MRSRSKRPKLRWKANLRPARQAGFEVNGQVADKNLDGVVAVAEVLNQFVMASPRVACPSMRKHSARRSMTLWRSTGQKERKNQLWRARGQTIASVSGNDIGRSCFRIFILSCYMWSRVVRWCSPASAAIVTQLVTRLRARG